MESDGVGRLAFTRLRRGVLERLGPLEKACLSLRLEHGSELVYIFSL